MRTKISRLEDAFNGHFDAHHAFLLTRMLHRIDGIDADIAAVDAQIEAYPAPFASAAARLDAIPGIGPVAAAVILAEIGADMARFPTAGHLCSWAKFSPGINSSAGKTKGNGSTGHGNRYLARVLGEAAVVASRTDTFLGERYRRIARRRGKKRAVVAVGRSILVIAWHLLADEDTHFTDLGADHFTKHTNPEVKKRNHIRQLEALGYTVTLTQQPDQTSTESAHRHFRIRRHAGAATRRHRHHGRASSGQAGRLGHHGPHFTGRDDHTRQLRRPLPGQPRRDPHATSTPSPPAGATTKLWSAVCSPTSASETRSPREPPVASPAASTSAVLCCRCMKRPEPIKITTRR